jgi:glycine dehydrogenase subunit 1
LALANVAANRFACFLGAGAYNHYVPSVVDYVLQRGEFYSAYTPYQPEISQGTLQAIFEYQSMICALTGMDVSNASHYDGATSLAEAVIMALNVHRGKRRTVILSHTIHPEYRQVVRTYVQGMDVVIVGDDDPTRDLTALQALLDDDTAMLALQNPNFFGQVEDLTPLAQACHEHKALLSVVADPISLGMFKSPGEMGADIVVGEGQPLGGGLNFGGPYLGFFATRDEYVRRMAGRLVGETTDTKGQRGYVLTLATREQHIRREKATSNICTNQGLLALAAAAYMAALGRCGLPRIASLCYHKAHYAAAEIDALEGYEVWQAKPFFKEFVVKCPRPVTEINQYLLEAWDIIGGYDLGRDYAHLPDHMLIAVTETNSREEIDDLVAGLAEVTP